MNLFFSGQCFQYCWLSVPRSLRITLWFSQCWHACWHLVTNSSKTMFCSGWDPNSPRGHIVYFVSGPNSYRATLCSSYPHFCPYQLSVSNQPSVVLHTSSHVPRLPPHFLFCQVPAHTLWPYFCTSPFSYPSLTSLSLIFRFFLAMSGSLRWDYVLLKDSLVRY